jgi:hypothetical protein
MPDFAAVREAARVLEHGGVLIAAAISRCASVLDGLRRERFGDRRFATLVERDLRVLHDRLLPESNLLEKVGLDS